MTSDMDSTVRLAVLGTNSESIRILLQSIWQTCVISNLQIQLGCHCHDVSKIISMYS